MDTSVLILLIENVLLGVKRADIIAREQVVAERLRACGSTVCYVSELSELEFLKAGVAKMLVAAEYRNALGQSKLMDRLRELYKTILANLSAQGLKISITMVEPGDMGKALEIAQRLGWDERNLGRKSFDIIILAQAVARGVKVLTTDRDFFEIRVKALPSSGKSDVIKAVGGLKIRFYEDDYVLYIG